jgi:hypothetical protein
MSNALAVERVALKLNQSDLIEIICPSFSGRYNFAEIFQHDENLQ